MPEVERYGVEPVPAAERTVGWRDLFAINFTFFLNPVMYVLGALAVTQGGLPLLWAIVAMVLGQALAFAALVVVARPGVDDGLPGQVAMRATFGLLGARVLTSPYRVIAATYWFAAQALTAAFGIQAIVVAMGGGKPPLVPTSLAVAVVQAALAVLGFDVMRWLLRVVLPLSVVSAGVIVGLYLTTDDPAYALDHVVRIPDQQATWVGFATFVTIMCGSSLTLVTNIADLCRYSPSRADMQVGLVSSALLSAVVTTFVGGYAAAASGETNPFVAVSRLTSSDARARRPPGRDRRPDARREPHERVHGWALAREHGAPSRAVSGATALAARRGGRPLGVPVVHRGGAAVGHAPRERRRAADRRRPGRLPHPCSEDASTSRRSSTRTAGIATCAASTSRPSLAVACRRRRVLRGAGRVAEGGVGRRRRRRRRTSRSRASLRPGPSRAPRASPPEAGRPLRPRARGAMNRQCGGMRALRGRRTLLGVAAGRR